MDPTHKMRAIGKTLLEAATPDMTLKQLIKAVRRHHPKASGKEIAQAAFFIIIEIAEADPDKAKKLHGFAIETRR